MLWHCVRISTKINKLCNVADNVEKLQYQKSYLQGLKEIITNNGSNESDNSNCIHC
jgi:hypothetical protein